MQSRAQDLALRPRHRARGAQGVRGRRARGGDAARLPRHRQGPPRRHARLPQELPDDDLRLVRDADGRRGRARVQTRMYEIAQAGHVPVISAMGNLPVVKDLVVDMEPFWAKFKAVEPWLRPGYAEPPDGKEYLVTQPEMNAIHKESLCINCGCCVSECNAMESDPEFLGPQALAKAMRFVGDPRDHADGGAARGVQRRARDLAVHPLLLLQRALPEGRRPARRDRQARRRGDAGRDRPRHGRQAREVVRHLGARRPAGCARRSSCRRRRGSSTSIKETKFALKLARHGKVPFPFPPHVAKNVERVARALRPRAGAGPRAATPGSSRARRRSARSTHGVDGASATRTAPARSRGPSYREEAAQ